MLDEQSTCQHGFQEPNYSSIAKAVAIALISLCIIIGNVLCLCVLNCPRSRGYFMETSRMLMTSLACTDCSMGILVTSLCIYPALYTCWPFGQFLCKIQAVLLSSLFHESTLSLTLIAVDRYVSITFPLRYPSVIKRSTVTLAIVCTWLGCFVVYFIVVFVYDQYYYDVVGVNCEPLYENSHMTLTVLFLFYLVPGIVMIFCYTRVFHIALYQRSRQRQNSVCQISDYASLNLIKNYLSISDAATAATKTLGLITVGFFVAVTPWTVGQLLASLAKIIIPDNLDFALTWLAISNSAWNVLIYAVTNASFRRATRLLLCHNSRSHHRDRVKLQYPPKSSIT
ncbi:hypothetical protein LOTGIDRAFT_127056 [Lottia gigantea]|uniref:G-protein coupled receptors family 1 profile domain-containing protein n=1 Tax=Lottia gigantea TaxID=225164 RepID=V3ZA87_LOTGI|nr:hypothetical protein LOTGIDRAFT_127056 [Lottia gigantea]ESO87863.1 hypothetical protein LOTGIDRAFT_127056 [Lottia gigantea]